MGEREGEVKNRGKKRKRKVERDIDIGHWKENRDSI